MHVEEVHVSDVVGVLVNDGSGHAAAVRKVCDERTDGDSGVLVSVAHEHADVDGPAGVLKWNAVVASSLWREVEVDVEVVVAEIDVKRA